MKRPADNYFPAKFSPHYLLPKLGSFAVVEPTDSVISARIPKYETDVNSSNPFTAGKIVGPGMRNFYERIKWCCCAVIYRRSNPGTTSGCNPQPQPNPTQTF